MQKAKCLRCNTLIKWVGMYPGCPNCDTGSAQSINMVPSKRATILDTAKSYVTKDRQATHGNPEDSFGMIARLWSAYLGQEVKAHDVCSMMALLKVARARENPTNDDNWIDMAGYAACGAEVASVQRGIEMEEDK